jgi:hypothetical protein
MNWRDETLERLDFSSAFVCLFHMKRAFRLLALVALFAMTTAISLADVTKLAAGDRDKLLKASDAPLVTTMREIPAEVVAACAAASSGGGFALADAGQPFQVTDVISNEKLPGKRLDWAARIPGYMIVHYETGGIAHMYHVMVVALDAGKKAHVVWAAGTKPLKSYAEFRAALIAEKLDDSLPYH